MPIIVLPSDYSCLMEMGGLALLVVGVGIAIAAAMIWVVRHMTGSYRLVLR